MWRSRLYWLYINDIRTTSKMLKVYSFPINILCFCFNFIDHREHSQRVMHEFILGPKNILRVQQKPKSQEYVSSEK